LPGKYNIYRASRDQDGYVAIGNVDIESDKVTMAIRTLENYDLSNLYHGMTVLRELEGYIVRNADTYLLFSKNLVTNVAQVIMFNQSERYNVRREDALYKKVRWLSGIALDFHDLGGGSKELYTALVFLRRANPASKNDPCVKHMSELLRKRTRNAIINLIKSPS
jgi:hypothetical protein